MQIYIYIYLYILSIHTIRRRNEFICVFLFCRKSTHIRIEVNVSIFYIDRTIARLYRNGRLHYIDIFVYSLCRHFRYVFFWVDDKNMQVKATRYRSDLRQRRFIGVTPWTDKEFPLLSVNVATQLTSNSIWAR